MYVLIVGGGRVGARLLDELLAYGHEVLVIEQSRQRWQLLREVFGTAAMVGDGCEVATLAHAGAERADLFIAVTDGDEDNLVACQVAQHYFHVRNVVARVNIPRNEEVFAKLGITNLINSVGAVVDRILHALPEAPVSRLATFGDKGLSLLSFQVTNASLSVGRKYGDLKTPDGVTISAVVRDREKVLLPQADLVCQAGDRVLVFAPESARGALAETFGG